MPNRGIGSKYTNKKGETKRLGLNNNNVRDWLPFNTGSIGIYNNVANRSRLGTMENKWIKETIVTSLAKNFSAPVVRNNTFNKKPKIQEKSKPKTQPKVGKPLSRPKPILPPEPVQPPIPPSLINNRTSTKTTKDVDFNTDIDFDMVNNNSEKINITPTNNRIRRRPKISNNTKTNTNRGRYNRRSPPPLPTEPEPTGFLVPPPVPPSPRKNPRAFATTDVVPPKQVNSRQSRNNKISTRKPKVIPPATRESIRQSEAYQVKKLSRGRPKMEKQKVVPRRQRVKSVEAKRRARASKADSIVDSSKPKLIINDILKNSIDQIQEESRMTHNSIKKITSPDKATKNKLLRTSQEFNKLDNKLEEVKDFLESRKGDLTDQDVMKQAKNVDQGFGDLQKYIRDTVGSDPLLSLQIGYDPTNPFNFKQFSNQTNSEPKSNNKPLSKHNNKPTFIPKQTDKKIKPINTKMITQSFPVIQRKLNPKSTARFLNASQATAISRKGFRNAAQTAIKFLRKIPK